jgi:putative protein-disulfide isomerase
MMTIEVRYYTDPACEQSWGMEPQLRKLIWEFGEELRFGFVMGGLARDYPPSAAPDRIAAWLESAARAGMPCDPRLWLQNPISSTYPACQAVAAASEQGPDAAYRYLRRLREGIFCERKKLDHGATLIAEAGAAGLDRKRFEIDLSSPAITEAFAADLEEVRGGDEPISLPTVAFLAGDGSRHEIVGPQSYEAYREAALAAGAVVAVERPGEPLEAIERFGRCATREIEELTGRPRPVVEAELWGLARDWRLKPIPALTGTLWEPA